MADELSFVPAESYSAYADSGVQLRLSGPLRDRPNPKIVVGAYYYATDGSVVYESTGKAWVVRGTLKKGDIAGDAYGLEADRPAAAKMIGWIYHATDTKKDHEAFPSMEGEGAWFTPPAAAVPWSPSSSDTSDSRAKLRSQLSNQSGAFLQSTGDEAIDGPVTYVILQTLDASPANPILVEFQQHIIEAFTGDGRFDLVESDPADDVVRDDENEIVSGGDSLATLATKTGFADGVTTGAWSRFAKVITSDKVFSVVGAPGDTGIGAFSLRVQSLLEVR